MLGTVIALAFSADPAAGLPQIRKFYVFLELLVVFSTLRNLQWVRWLFLTWAGIASLTAVRGFVQFGEKVQQAHQAGRGLYDFYVASASPVSPAIGTPSPPRKCSPSSCSALSCSSPARTNGPGPG